MAVSFRLSYNSGLGFVDLFPGSGMSAVQGIDNIMSYSTIDVTIPAPDAQDVTQTIAITTTDAQVNAPVYMVLNSTGNQSEKDYATINQFQIQTNSLVITRLYSWPKDSINVTLIFKEASI